MAYSKISICNLSLAICGAGAIRDFDEANKRARMADVFYEPTKDYLLSRIDWSFARKFKKLNLLSLPEDEVPEGQYPYQLPNDCKVPRILTPVGGRTSWELLGDILMCDQPSNVALYYTATGTPVARFTDPFVNVLALGIAVRLAPPISQDSDLVDSLYKQFLNEQKECWESDANIGNIYREFDEDPSNDTFVAPDLAGYLGNQDVPWNT